MRASGFRMFGTVLLLKVECIKMSMYLNCSADGGMNELETITAIVSNSFILS